MHGSSLSGYRALVRMILTPALLAAASAAQIFTPEDSERVVAALDLYEQLAAQKPDLWPGLDLTAVPVAIYRPGGGAVLVGRPNPPPGRELRPRS